LHSAQQHSQQATAMVSLSTASECIVAALAGPSFFDVEVAIAGLLADPNRATLELPCSLSAEQRKHAKKVAEKHPDLWCESFGLGKERRVHLFKRSSEGSSGVRVKNTFIDDWHREGPDERLVQSLPHNMFGHCLSAEQSSRAAPTEENLEVPALSSVGEHVPLALAPLPNLDGDTLLEDQVFALGTEIIIDGLLQAPSFNGSLGSVQSWDEATGRYNVLLASATAGGQRWAKIKSENLQHAAFPTSRL